MQQVSRQQPVGECVIVSANARLHLGFLDISGTLGRRFGSLGVSIEGYRTRLRAQPARTVWATGPDSERAAHFAKQALARLGIGAGAGIELDTTIPGHLGLGSGTQLALAVGRAIASLYGTPLTTQALAAALSRGRRSGIGIGAFDQGGFLVDSGVGGEGDVPAVTARLPFPEEWRLLLVMDTRGKGLHGHQEVAAFRHLPPFPRDVAAHLCHLTLMQILPGVRSRCIEPVAAGIAELQRYVGDHFAPAQGGRFTSPAVAKAMACAESLGFPGVGQSSWGPTGFVILPDDAAADRLLVELRRQFGDLSPLRYLVTAACNTGSRTEIQHAAEAAKEVR